MRDDTDDLDDPRERMLDAVLAEHLSARELALGAERALAGSALQRDAAWQRARTADAAARPRWQPTWLVVAALLGVAVVAATMWQRRATAMPEPRLPVPAQDPQVRTVTPRDLAHFVELARSAKLLRIGGSDIVGATKVSDATGDYDRLDVRRWPEIVVVDGERLAAWARAIAASASRLERRTRLGTLLSAHFVQPDGTVLAAGCSVGDEVFLDPGLDGGMIAPDDALRHCMQAAHEELERAHRVAAGEVRDANDLDALPATTTSVRCPWLDDGSLPRRLHRFPALRALALIGGAVDADALRALATDPLPSTLTALELRGDALHDGALAALAAMPRLAELRVRGGAFSGAGFASLTRLATLSLHGCGGLTADGVRSLARLRELRTLRLDGCELGAAGEVLAVLPSLPVLERLELRGGAIAPGHLAPLVRTKLRTLRLADVPVTGDDLAPFAELPSLRELAVLAGTLGDGAVAELASLRQLERLQLQNVMLSPDGVADLRAALPRCAVDCTPGQRLFDSALWLR